MFAAGAGGLFDCPLTLLCGGCVGVTLPLETSVAPMAFGADICETPLLRLTCCMLADSCCTDADVAVGGRVWKGCGGGCTAATFG